MATARPSSDDDLMTWIAELRDHLARRGLATLAPVDVGHGTDAMPVEHTVRVMLADLDSFEDMTPDEADDPINVKRRFHLLSDFEILQSLIG